MYFLLYQLFLYDPNFEGISPFHGKDWFNLRQTESLKVNKPGFQSLQFLCPFIIYFKTQIDLAK